MEAYVEPQTISQKAQTLRDKRSVLSTTVQQTQLAHLRQRMQRNLEPGLSQLKQKQCLPRGAVAGMLRVTFYEREADRSRATRTNHSLRSVLVRHPGSGRHPASLVRVLAASYSLLRGD